MECRSENVTQGLSLTGLYFIPCLHQAWRAARNFSFGLGSPGQGTEGLLLPAWRRSEEPPACPRTSHLLISVPCPDDTSFAIPLGGAKIIWASPTTNKHLTDVFVSAPGKTTTVPHYWLLLIACHGSLSFGARFPNWPAEMWNVPGGGCRNSCSKSGGLGFCSLFGWLFRWGFCSL